MEILKTGNYRPGFFFILLILQPWSPHSETLGRIVNCDLLFSLFIYFLVCCQIEVSISDQLLPSLTLTPSFTPTPHLTPHSISYPHSSPHSSPLFLTPSLTSPLTPTSHSHLSPYSSPLSLTPISHPCLIPHPHPILWKIF